jgi:bifunctional non-homologous end joining protein LigD
VGFGALLVGYWEAGRLVDAGKVGTGFDNSTLRALARRLAKIELRGAKAPRGVHLVAPELVCEVGFTEWTTDGKLRHPRFLGLRDDKNPRDVVREE